MKKGLYHNINERKKKGISRPKSKSPWPEQEVWLFASAPETRMARVTGLPAIDTSQVYLSDEWEQLPGYMMTPDAVMDIEVSHRGIPLQIRNELTLSRKLWLNFDGEAFTFSDSITGNMIKDWRLKMPAPYVLESAQDQDGPLLVSEISAIRGIENRYPATHIEAQGQLQQLSNFDIGGWQQEFDTIQYDLQLPPGYRLFAIFGADKTSNTWVDKWNLWNSFIVLLITGLIASLYNKPLALLGLFTMVLVYHEPGSPIIAIGIALLCIALYRQLKGTRVNFLSSCFQIYGKISQRTHGVEAAALGPEGRGQIILVPGDQLVVGLRVGTVLQVQTHAGTLQGEGCVRTAGADRCCQ